MDLDFSDNNANEIFFVDGAETALTRDQKETLSSAAAHFIECFNIDKEVDVYISKISILHKFAGVKASAWHMPPHYDRGDNHIVCVYLDPEASLKRMIILLAHEMIHAWQVNRGDMQGATNWKGQDYSCTQYQLQPWEIEAWAFMEEVAEFYFEDRHPSASELSAIKTKTDLSLKALNVKTNTQLELKNKLMKVGKVAGIVGLAALFGL